MGDELSQASQEAQDFCENPTASPTPTPSPSPSPRDDRLSQCVSELLDAMREKQPLQEPLKSDFDKLMKTLTDKKTAYEKTPSIDAAKELKGNYMEGKSALAELNKGQLERLGQNIQVPANPRPNREIDLILREQGSEVLTQIKTGDPRNYINGNTTSQARATFEMAQQRGGSKVRFLYDENYKPEHQATNLRKLKDNLERHARDTGHTDFNFDRDVRSYQSEYPGIEDCLTQD